MILLNRLSAFLAACLLSVISAGPLFAQSAPLRLAQTIPLPGVEGRIDHFAWDAKDERLFVVALGNDTVEVIDLKSGQRLNTLRGFHEPQGVLFLPESNQIVVSSGRGGAVDFFDGTTLERLGAVKLSDDADNMRYDSASKLVYVGYGEGGLAVIDPKTLKQVADIPLEGHPEAFQLETSGPQIYVNLPPDQIAVVDKASKRVVVRWTFADRGRANFPMALDETRHRLFVGIRQPAKLVVFDTESGKIKATLAIVSDPDDIFFDSEQKRLYITGGGGRITVIDELDADHYQTVADISTASGARTSLFLPVAGRLCLAVPQRFSQPAEVRIYERAIKR